MPPVFSFYFIVYELIETKSCQQSLFLHQLDPLFWTKLARLGLIWTVLDWTVPGGFRLIRMFWTVLNLAVQSCSSWNGTSFFLNLTWFWSMTKGNRTALFWMVAVCFSMSRMFWTSLESPGLDSLKLFLN